MKTIQSAIFSECQNKGCNFRYPSTNLDKNDSVCPSCGSSTKVTDVLNLNEDLRVSTRSSKPSNPPLTILDNIRSVFNVGSIFRTAVGLGLEKIILCGITPTPDHPNFTKTSLSAEKEIMWEWHPNSASICKDIKARGSLIISIEASSSSSDIATIDRSVVNRQNIVVVFGNEIAGIDPQVLKISDRILSIPVYGRNTSYNVATAYGIVMYQFVNNLCV